MNDLEEQIAVLRESFRRLVGVEVATGMAVEEAAFVLAPLDRWADRHHEEWLRSFSFDSAPPAVGPVADQGDKS